MAKRSKRPTSNREQQIDAFQQEHQKDIDFQAHMDKIFDAAHLMVYGEPRKLKTRIKYVRSLSIADDGQLLIDGAPTNPADEYLGVTSYIPLGDRSGKA